MTTTADQSEIIADPAAPAWQARAPELAAWAEARLVNRTDVWGLYTRWNDENGVEHGSMTAPPRKHRGKVRLTRLDLEQHFRGLAGNVKGLHSTSPDNTCRWFAYDFDNHSDEPDLGAKNLAQALLLVEHLHDYGFVAILEDSNGDGGYHVWVLLAAPAPSAAAYAFAQQILTELSLSAEVFPKQAGVGKGYGNFLRIPGKHHSRNHWSRIYQSGRWLEGLEAVEAILNAPVNAPALLPAPPVKEELVQTKAINRQLSSPPRPGRRSDAQIAGDCLQHLGGDVADDRASWIKVGQILYDIDPELLAEWDAWSQQSEKYKAGECAGKWKGFGRRHGKAATLGTLVYLARRGGANIRFYDEPPAPGKPVIVPRPDSGSGKARILIDPDEYRVANETVKALAADTTIFQRGGVLVRVIRDEPKEGAIRRSAGSATITFLPQACLRERMTKYAEFTTFAKRGDTVEEIVTHPTQWLVAAVDARGEWPGIRQLTGISDVPVLRADGTLCQTPGYDQKTGVLYDPSGEFPPVHDEVTIDDADAAIEEIFDVVCDFRFESPEHRSAWLAALLTPLARFAFDGPAPLFLVDANVRGAGKGLLVQTIGYIVLGREMPVSSYAHNPEEMRKKITAIALAGDRMIHLDNLEGNFGNDTLDRALTATRWKDRILGKSQEVDLPLIPVWFGTGNNVAVAADTTRRIIHIRLDVLEEKPEERTGFKHPELITHIKKNRGKLLAAAFTILRAYCNAGRPRQNVTPFGSFEGWSRLVREAIVWAGQPDPCLTRTKLAESSDTTADSLGQLITAWEAYDIPVQGIVVSEALSKLYARDFPPRDDASIAMRAALENLVGCPPGRVPGSRQVGAKFKLFRRRVIGGIYIDTNPNEHNRNGAVWRLHHA